MRVRVATLNVWALPEPFAADVRPRMKSIGKRLDAFPADVVAFQEVWSEGARKKLVRRGRRAGFVHDWHTGDALGGSGLLVISKLPILEASFEPFELSGFPEKLDNGEYLSGKGFAILRLQGSDGPFKLISTHLHARYKKTVDHAFRAHRAGQIIQLAGHTRASRDPLLLVGDFNIREQQPEYGMIRSLTGTRDSAAVLGDREPTVVHTNPYRSPNPSKNRRIDYVFYRDGQEMGVRPISVDRVFDEDIDIDGHRAAYSNHAGVLTEFEIAPDAFSGPVTVEPEAIALASRLLAEGRDQAEWRQASSRAFAGAGVACAVVAGVGSRGPLMSRRSFLRNTCRATAAAAVGSVVGCSVFSEYLVPDEFVAFSDAESSLRAIASRDAPGASTPS